MNSVLKNVCKLKVPLKIVEHPHLVCTQKTKRLAIVLPKTNVNFKSSKCLATASYPCIAKRSSIRLTKRPSCFQRSFSHKPKSAGIYRSGLCEENDKKSDEVSEEDCIHQKNDKRYKRLVDNKSVKFTVELSEAVNAISKKYNVMKMHGVNKINNFILKPSGCRNCSKFNKKKAFNQWDQKRSYSFMTKKSQFFLNNKIRKNVSYKNRLSPVKYKVQEKSKEDCLKKKQPTKVPLYLLLKEALTTPEANVGKYGEKPIRYQISTNEALFGDLSVKPSSTAEDRSSSKVAFVRKLTDKNDDECLTPIPELSHKISECKENIGKMKKHPILHTLSDILIPLAEKESNQYEEMRKALVRLQKELELYLSEVKETNPSASGEYKAFKVISNINQLKMNNKDIKMPIYKDDLRRDGFSKIIETPKLIAEDSIDNYPTNRELFDRYKNVSSSDQVDEFPIAILVKEQDAPGGNCGKGHSSGGNSEKNCMSVLSPKKEERNVAKRTYTSDTRHNYVGGTTRTYASDKDHEKNEDKNATAEAGVKHANKQKFKGAMNKDNDSDGDCFQYFQGNSIPPEDRKIQKEQFAIPQTEITTKVEYQSPKVITPAKASPPPPPDQPSSKITTPFNEIESQFSKPIQSQSPESSSKQTFTSSDKPSETGQLGKVGKETLKKLEYQQVKEKEAILPFIEEDLLDKKEKPKKYTYKEKDETSLSMKNESAKNIVAQQSSKSTWKPTKLSKSNSVPILKSTSASTDQLGLKKNKRISLLDNCRGLFETLFKKLRGPPKRNVGSSFNFRKTHSAPVVQICDDLFVGNISTQRKKTKKITFKMKQKYPWNRSRIDGNSLAPNTNVSKKVYSTKSRKFHMFKKDYSTNSTAVTTEKSFKKKYPWNISDLSSEENRNSCYLTKTSFCNKNKISSTEPELPKLLDNAECFVMCGKSLDPSPIIPSGKSEDLLDKKKKKQDCKKKCDNKQELSKKVCKEKKPTKEESTEKVCEQKRDPSKKVCDKKVEEPKKACDKPPPKPQQTQDSSKEEPKNVCELKPTNLFRSKLQECTIKMGDSFCKTKKSSGIKDKQKKKTGPTLKLCQTNDKLKKIQNKLNNATKKNKNKFESDQVVMCSNKTKTICSKSDGSNNNDIGIVCSRRKKQFYEDCEEKSTEPKDKCNDNKSKEASCDSCPKPNEKTCKKEEPAPPKPVCNLEKPKSMQSVCQQEETKKKCDNSKETKKCENEFEKIKSLCNQDLENKQSPKCTQPDVVKQCLNNETKEDKCGKIVRNFKKTTTNDSVKSGNVDSSIYKKAKQLVTMASTKPTINQKKEEEQNVKVQAEKKKIVRPTTPEEQAKRLVINAMTKPKVIEKKEVTAKPQKNGKCQQTDTKKCEYKCTKKDEEKKCSAPAKTNKCDQGGHEKKKAFTCEENIECFPNQKNKKCEKQQKSEGTGDGEKLKESKCSNSQSLSDQKESKRFTSQDGSSCSKKEEKKGPEPKSCGKCEKKEDKKGPEPKPCSKSNKKEDNKYSEQKPCGKSEKKEDKKGTELQPCTKSTKKEDKKYSEQKPCGKCEKKEDKPGPEPKPCGKKDKKEDKKDPCPKTKSPPSPSSSSKCEKKEKTCPRPKQSEKCDRLVEEFLHKMKKDPKKDQKCPKETPPKSQPPKSECPKKKPTKSDCPKKEPPKSECPKTECPAKPTCIQDEPSCGNSKNNKKCSSGPQEATLQNDVKATKECLRIKDEIFQTTKTCGPSDQIGFEEFLKIIDTKQTNKTSSSIVTKQKMDDKLSDKNQGDKVAKVADEKENIKSEFEKNEEIWQKTLDELISKLCNKWANNNNSKISKQEKAKNVVASTDDIITFNFDLKNQEINDDVKPQKIGTSSHETEAVGVQESEKKADVSSPAPKEKPLLGNNSMIDSLNDYKTSRHKTETVGVQEPEKKADVSSPAPEEKSLLGKSSMIDSLNDYETWLKMVKLQCSKSTAVDSSELNGLKGKTVADKLESRDVLTPKEQTNMHEDEFFKKEGASGESADTNKAQQPIARKTPEKDVINELRESKVENPFFVADELEKTKSKYFKNDEIILAANEEVDVSSREDVKTKRSQLSKKLDELFFDAIKKSKIECKTDTTNEDVKQNESVLQDDQQDQDMLKLLDGNEESVLLPSLSNSMFKPKAGKLSNENEMFICQIESPCKEASKKSLRTLKCKRTIDEEGREVFMCTELKKKISNAKVHQGTISTKTGSFKKMSAGTPTRRLCSNHKVQDCNESNDTFTPKPLLFTRQMLENDCRKMEELLDRFKTTSTDEGKEIQKKVRRIYNTAKTLLSSYYLPNIKQTTPQKMTFNYKDILLLQRIIQNSNNKETLKYYARSRVD